MFGSRNREIIGTFVIKVRGVERPSKDELLVVVHALDSLGFRFRLGERRKQHASQHGNNGYDDKEFDQGES